MNTRRCEVCGKSFLTKQPTTITCSDPCRNKRNAKRAGRQAWQASLSSSTVGAVSEMMVAIHLMKKGYAVFRALSASCFCDLIAIKDGKIMTIEARTGYANLLNGKLSYPKKAHGVVDGFGIFVPAHNEAYFFDSNHEPMQL